MSRVRRCNHALTDARASVSTRRTVSTKSPCSYYSLFRSYVCVRSRHIPTMLLTCDVYAVSDSTVNPVILDAEPWMLSFASVTGQESESGAGEGYGDSERVAWTPIH